MAFAFSPCLTLKIIIPTSYFLMMMHSASYDLSLTSSELSAPSYENIELVPSVTKGLEKL